MKLYSEQEKSVVGLLAAAAAVVFALPIIIVVNRFNDQVRKMQNYSAGREMTKHGRS